MVHCEIGVVGSINPDAPLAAASQRESGRLYARDNTNLREAHKLLCGCDLLMRIQEALTFETFPLKLAIQHAGSLEAVRRILRRTLMPAQALHILVLQCRGAQAEMRCALSEEFQMRMVDALVTLKRRDPLFVQDLLPTD